MKTKISLDKTFTWFIFGILKIDVCKMRLFLEMKISMKIDSYEKKRFAFIFGISKVDLTISNLKKNDITSQYE